MLAVPKSTRRLSITASQIGDDAPDLNQLVRWSASLQIGKRPKLKEWILDGQPTAGYIHFKPTYRFMPDYSEVGELQNVGVVSKATERCFGSRGPAWTIWIMGDELLKCIREFRLAYIKIEREKKEDLTLLDLWVESIYEALKQIYEDDIPTHPAQPSGLLEVPVSGLDSQLVRRTARRQVPSFRRQESEDPTVSSYPESEAEPATGAQDKAGESEDLDYEILGDTATTQGINDYGRPNKPAAALVQLLKRKQPEQAKQPPVQRSKKQQKTHNTAESDEEDDNTLVYRFFTKVDGRKNYWKCNGCRREISADRTSNLHKHQGKCTGLIEAIQKGMPGITSKARAKASHLLKSQQTTPDKTTGNILQEWTESACKARLYQWIIQTAQPFSVVDQPSFVAMYRYNAPDFKVPCANTIKNNLQKIYNNVRDRLDDLVRAASQETVIHFAHDTWTDKECRNSFMGVTVTWVDRDWQRREVLLRFGRLECGHRGEQIGNALFRLFKDIGIAGSVGPGTGDNASSNKTAAMQLAGRLLYEESNNIQGSDIVGCLCHVANLAANDFLKIEKGMDAEDYPEEVTAGIPLIRVVGESEDRLVTDDYIDPEDEEGAEIAGEDGHEGYDSEEEDATLKEKQQRQKFNNSPLGYVHRLAKIVLRSPTRRQDFHNTRNTHQPELQQRKPLPRKDVKTRWNSTYDAVGHIIQLKPTVLAYTAEYASVSSGIPRFTPEVFTALEVIQPALEVFLHLTKEYSKVETTIHKSIKHLHLASIKLSALKAQAIPARQRSFDHAIQKLEKYLRPMLKNNWVCAAIALNPTNKEHGLISLFETFKMPERTEEVVAFIQARMEIYKPQDEGKMEDDIVVLDREESPDPFAIHQSQQSQLSVREDLPNDAWGEFNSRFASAKYIDARPGENILHYWKRQEDTNIRLCPLARVARDVYGLSSSSTSVERLFSQSGKTLGMCRGRLSAEMLLKQTSLKVWAVEQKLFSAKDLEAIIA